MNVLIACEESQAECIEFRKLGHNAFSCDIQECSGGHPEWHIQTNVLDIINGKCVFKTCDNTLRYINTNWDLIIAHPPCTYLSKAGARWLYPKAGIIDPVRYEKGLAALDFFNSILQAECDKIVVENPVPLKIFNLPVPSQKIQPYQFGEPFSKCTCLWIKGDLPLLLPTNILSEYKPYIDSNCSKAARGLGKGFLNGVRGSKLRSKTFKGIALAMAQQWGGKI